jgi:hypothetical protein
MCSGRKLEEIDFSRGEQRVKIGRFDACDYFGDGSFFILDAPGVSLLLTLCMYNIL